MALKVAINGFGRIGRLVVRSAKARKAPLDFVAVNDLTDAATLAHLLKYDSVHGVWHEASSQPSGNQLVIQGDTIAVLAEKDPAKLPWKSLGVDIVLEATGRFTERDKAALHIGAGAKAVLVSAPAKGADITFVFGVNDQLFDRARHQVFSIGSCTTNCLAPLAKVLDDSFGIDHGLMTTIHAYTNDQNILDLPHKDLRRARAAAVNVIPTSTGAAKAIGLVMPEMKGRLDGISMRVPVPDGSATDLIAQLGRETTRDEVNEAFKAAAASGPLAPVLDYSEEPLVSGDIVGQHWSSIFDSKLTMVNGNLVKVVSWYDNEWGYSCRLVDLMQKVL